MLEEIRIRNFQSHADTVLKLHPGVNSIEGNSDGGKTATMRALLWCAANEGSGLADVSWWATTKSGEIKKGQECSVTAVVDGMTVKRERTDKFNGYRTEKGGDTEVYEALGKKFPQDVADAFNLSVVNRQEQADGPFFLSGEWTPGERARYINKLVKLDEIDAAMAECSSRIRENTSRRKITEEELAEAEAKVKLTDDADLLPSMLSTMDELEAAVSSAGDTTRRVGESLDEWEAATRTLQSLESEYGDLDRVVREIGAVSTDMERLKSECAAAFGDIDEYENAVRLLHLLDLSGMEQLVDGIGSGEKAIDAAISVLNSTNGIRDYLSAVVVCATAEEVAVADELAESIHDAEAMASTFMRDSDDLGKQIKLYETSDADERDCSVYLEDDIRELSTMACPLCGHVGCAC